MVVLRFRFSSAYTPDMVYPNLATRYQPQDGWGFRSSGGIQQQVNKLIWHGSNSLNSVGGWGFQDMLLVCSVAPTTPLLKTIPNFKWEYRTVFFEKAKLVLHETCRWRPGMAEQGFPIIL
jgi:hypothetical protein